MQYNQIKSISFIGSGNVATHLAKVVKEHGIQVKEIYSPTYANALQLANEVAATAVKNMSDLKAVDLLVISVKDDVIDVVANQLSKGHVALVHTSGAVDLKVLSGKADNVGVFYPLQSFRKTDSVNWSEVPICIEAGNDQFAEQLFAFGNLISNQVSYLNSTQRLHLHVAAVMVNNFSNYLFAMAHEVVTKQNLSFGLLLPLIRHTALRLTQADPMQLQTGPAIRNDMDVIQHHINLLSGNPEARELYKFMSEQIIKKAP